MYKIIIRPLFFMFQPETAHKIVFTLLKTLHILKLNFLVKWLCHPKRLHMETRLWGLTFPNKIGIAAGLDKNAEVYETLGNMGFGHVEIGTVTPKPQSGNPKPRSFRLVKDKALINRMGFNNYGLEQAVINMKNRKNSLIVGGNIGKNTLTKNEDALHDYVACFEGLYDYVDYIAVNVSCPNITDLHKLQDQDSLELILNTLDNIRNSKNVRKPILLKVSPDLNFKQIDETLAVVHKCHIDGVIAVNTTTLRDNLISDAETVKMIGNGGLSGKPIRERSTEIIRYMHQKTNGTLPIIGVGGVFDAADAIEKLQAGASLVQVYSGFIYEGPGMAKQINRAIKKLQM